MGLGEGGESEDPLRKEGAIIGGGSFGVHTTVVEKRALAERVGEIGEELAEKICAT